MAFVLIYSYILPAGAGTRYISRDDTDLSIIDYYDAGGDFSGGAQPSNGTRVGSACQPGTFDQYTYFSSTSGSPYATYTILPNSTYCGYVPPVCDITEVSFDKTDETSPGANDGTANLFCTSSKNPIAYQLNRLPGTVVGSNTTGYFIGLIPADYFIIATDVNFCSITEFFTILPYSADLTHFKYKLAFTDVQGRNNWELRLNDMRNSYDVLQYPKNIKGTEVPVVRKTDNPDEDKTTVVLSSQLDINLWYDASVFTVDEFSLAPERSWFVEYYLNGDIEFKGWLIPDETQNFYRDPSYGIRLLATDGLPSLKGNKWGDGSGGGGYSTTQIQQYGLAAWLNLVKQCMDQLGYAYGSAILVNSLRYNDTYDRDMWLKLGTWSDILYDGTGIPVDTYTALETLLAPFKLCIFQHKGAFVFINWNDLYYIDKGLVSAQYYAAYYRFADDFSNVSQIGSDVTQPLVQPIGFNTLNKPINPPQSINYDKAYNISAKIDFNILALLYENPSFEVGPVQGALPSGFSANGSPNIFVNYDPFDIAVNGSGAYDGDWELKVKGSGLLDRNIFIQNQTPFIPIDQYNKLLNISFAWKPSPCGHTTHGGAMGYIFSVTAIYIDSISGQGYFLFTPQSAAGEYSSGLFPVVASPPAQTQWQLLSGTGPITPYQEGDATGIKPPPTTDTTSWQQFNITAPPFPDSQIGVVTFRIYGVKMQLFDKGKYEAPSDYDVNKLYVGVPADDTGYVLIDQLNLTLSDANPVQALQVGETHTVTAVTGVPQANIKDLDIKMFTYPNNKRVAGNIFTTHDYTTGIVANLWSFNTKSLDPRDRLPATVVRAIARNYAKQFHIFEGDVSTIYLQFYGLFTLQGYEGRLFMPFSITHDCRNCIAHVILVELSDADIQAVYKYLPMYEKQARKNVN